MGKYKRLKEAHEDLRKDFQRLIKTLQSEGSLIPHCSMCNEFIGGQHGFRINKNELNIKAVQFHIGKLEEVMGIELTHTDEWNYTEKENTDE